MPQDYGMKALTSRSNKDALIIILGLILWAVTVRDAYQQGAEDGYWEHEAEENVYQCEVNT